MAEPAASEPRQPQPASRSWLAMLPLWQQIAGAVTAVGALVIAVVSYFNPLGTTDLTVWVRQEVPIVVPEDLPSLPVTLHYGDEEIRRATVLEVRVINSGAVPLGEGGPWWLDLAGEDGTRLVALSTPVASPRNVQVEVEATESPASLRLQLGLLNPGDSVDLNLVVLDPVDAARPALAALTRIPNLRQPVVTRLPLVERIHQGYHPALFLFLWVGLFGALAWERYHKGLFHSAGVGDNVGALVGAFFLSPVAAYFVSWIVAWPLAYGVLWTIAAGS